MPGRDSTRPEARSRSATAWAWRWLSPGSEFGHDVDELAALALPETDLAGGEGEQRVVTTATDVRSGVKVRAALAHDDRAGAHDVAVGHLHAEALGFESRPFRVEPPPLVFDISSLLGLRRGGADVGDLDGAVVLAMAEAWHERDFDL